MQWAWPHVLHGGGPRGQDGGRVLVRQMQLRVGAEALRAGAQRGGRGKPRAEEGRGGG